MAKHAYERFLASLGVDSKAYHADNGRLQIKASEMIVSLATKLLPFVELVAIIRMALLSARLKILHLALELCYCMQNDCFQSTF